MGYLYLFTAIACTVTSQLLVKWRIMAKFADRSLPAGILAKICFLLEIVFDPFLFTSLVLTFSSGLLWMSTMAKLDISYAYPFTSLGFVLVLVFSAVLLGETLNIYKVVGICVIVVGIIIVSRG